MYNTPIERKISMDIQILLFIQENIRNYILTPFFTLITNEYFLYAILVVVLIYMFKKNDQTRKLAKETIIPVFRGLHHECLEAILRKN